MSRFVFPTIALAFSVFTGFVNQVSAQPEKAPQAPEKLEYRVWTRADGTQSIAAALVRVEAHDRVLFRDQDNRTLQAPFSLLSSADQEFVRRHGMRQVNRPLDGDTQIQFVSAQAPTEETAGESSVDESDIDEHVVLQENGYLQPPSEAEAPLTMIIEREVTYTVETPITKTVRVRERYGRLCRKYRWVTKNITESVQESRSRTTQALKTIPSLLSLPQHAKTDKLVSLEVPPSAGAISERVALLLDQIFPPDQFSFIRSAGGNVVDYRQDTPKDDVRLQIVATIQQDPSRISLLTVAVNLQNPANAQAKSDEIWDQIQQTLTKKP